MCVCGEGPRGLIINVKRRGETIVALFPDQSGCGYLTPPLVFQRSIHLHFTAVCIYLHTQVRLKAQQLIHDFFFYLCPYLKKKSANLEKHENIITVLNKQELAPTACLPPKLRLDSGYILFTSCFRKYKPLEWHSVIIAVWSRELCLKSTCEVTLTF